MNNSFTIYYFVGEVPPASVGVSKYIAYSTLGGLSHIFTAPVEICDNCGNQAVQSQLQRDTAPITPILMDYILNGSLADLTPENVQPFLVKNLKWRVVTVSFAKQKYEGLH